MLLPNTASGIARSYVQLAKVERLTQSKQRNRLRPALHLHYAHSILMTNKEESISRKRKVDEIGGSEAGVTAWESHEERTLKRVKQQQQITNPSSPLLPSSDFAAIFEQDSCSSSCSAPSLPVISSNVLSPSEFSDELECAICRETFLVC
jgi:hypothetical protein